MLINFLGDSITEGVGASSKEKMYVELVKAKLGAEVGNYGISGTRISKKVSKSIPESFDLDFQLRAPQMKKGDFLFIFGGTNDWGHGDCEIGDINSTDPYTFSGGLNTLLNIILKDYKKDEFCFLLPLHRDNEENPLGDGREIPTVPLKKYVDTMVKILEKNNINYINLYEVGPKFNEVKDDHNFFADQVHPNDFGHEFLANVVVDYLRDNKMV